MDASRAVRTRVREPQTPAERMLWRALRGRAVNGLRWRRQVPMDGLVLDFFSSEVKLCVALDRGADGGGQEGDAEGTARLDARGVRVVRVREDEVVEDLPAVLRRIAKAATRYPASSYTASTPSSLRAQAPPDEDDELDA